MTLIDEIKKWKEKRLLIIGEALVDKYIIGNADRISPDAPVPNIKIDETLTYIGAAGLVVQFIKSLGGIPNLCTIIGNDYEGDFFLKRIKDLNINSSGIIIDKNINTPQVTRIKAMTQHVLRMETHYSSDISNSIYNTLFEQISARAGTIDAILILDYGIGGMFNEHFVQKLLDLLEHDFTDIPIIVRPNITNYYLYENVDLIKMNLYKALKSLSIDCCTETSASIAAQKILFSSKCKNILLNYLESDSYVFSKEAGRIEKISPILKEPVRSYVSVGSIIMAILGMSFAAKLPIYESAKLALYGAALSATLKPVIFFDSKSLERYIVEH